MSFSVGCSFLSKLAAFPLQIMPFCPKMQSEEDITECQKLF